MTQNLQTISDVSLQNLLDTKSSLTQIIFAIGYKSNGGYLSSRLLDRMKSLDVEKFESNKEQFKEYKPKRCDDEIFVECGKYTDRKTAKERLLLEREYVCEICKISDWNGIPITLHLDHTNGNNLDHRKTNLRLLCPNCHSQTETYSGRNRKIRKPTYYCSCGNIKLKDSINCKLCDDKHKIKWPSKEEMENLIWKIPTTKISKQLGVSDTAVKNFCREHNISKPSRGYWTKFKGV